MGVEGFIEIILESQVLGLAWTIAGGEVLDTEAVTIKGKGHLILTGQMGDVMKESAETAYKMCIRDRK